MAPARVRLRHLKAGDYRQIRKIERASVAEYRRYLKDTGESDTISSSMTSRYFQHYLKTGSSFAAEMGEKIVGYVLSQPTSFVHGRRKELWLEYIVIVSKSRRKGIGSKLLTEVLTWAQKNHFNLLYTTLNPNNPESRRLLHKCGFEVRKWLTAQRILK